MDAKATRAINRLAVLLLVLAGSANAQNVPYSNIVISAAGRPVAGAGISVCNSPGLATTAASVSSNLVTLTMASNPITAGFAANMTLQVSGFTGGDTYLNGGTLSGSIITGGFTILAVTPTTIVYQLSHANASATSNGFVFQQGNISTPCAPLGSITSDQAGLAPITQPGLVSNNLGNYSFYAAAGPYTLQYNGSGVVVQLQPIAVPVSTANNNTFTGNLNICVSNGFYFTATPSCYATVSAAFDAACALNPAGTVTIPPGTYTGPLASHFCSNMTVLGLTTGENRATVGNLGVTPLTATTPVTLNYVALLNLTSIQNLKMANVSLDFGSCTGCGVQLTSSSFNQFSYVTLNNTGDTTVPALMLTVTNGTSAALGSVWNTFDHLRINCNGATNHYCYAAVELLGAGSVNVAPAAFATLNSFYDLGVTGQYKYCIDAELNSDTNYFWHVDCNENTNGIANSAVLAFNLNNPTSDQDADGGRYDGVIVAGFGPASFIRAGQSNGNTISISQGSSGLPSLLAATGCTIPTTCNPLYTVQNIGLPAVNSNFYVGGTLYSLGAMNLTLPTTVAGDVVSARDATHGGFFGGNDGASIFRSGTLWSLGGSTVAGLAFNEQAQSACGAGQDTFLGDQVSHMLRSCYNGNSLLFVPQTANSSGTHSDSGLYQTATATGCTTAASIGGVCATAMTFTWPVAFADTNYRVTCTPVGAPTNLPSNPFVVTPSVGSATVNYYAITAAAASWPTVNCTAIHN